MSIHLIDRITEQLMMWGFGIIIVSALMESLLPPNMLQVLVGFGLALVLPGLALVIISIVITYRRRKKRENSNHI